MTFRAGQRETLRHNPNNAVTGIVERITDAAGHTLIRKELRRPAPSGERGPRSWAASTDPRHWNYWRREVLAYGSDALLANLQAAGLDLPRCEIEEHDAGITLSMEDVTGTPGTDFTLDDHVALATATGRWQAQRSAPYPWASRGFLRDYSGSREAPWHLVDDDACWQHRLVRDCWPADLRAGWQRLLAHRQTLLALMERLPRAFSHLDLWVSNEIRRPGGQIVLLDWAFCGDGAIGEDIGNHVPDAIFDLFWPAQRFTELDDACFEAYLSGLHEAGWRGSRADVRLGVVASCVKYCWLLPRMLARAAEPEHRAYHRIADPYELYHQRGLVLTQLVAWCDEALRLSTRK